MSLDAMEFLPQSRTIRYRTDDQINKLRIKIILELHDTDDMDAPWLLREQVFSWQEKIFGPAEFEKYSKMAAGQQLSSETSGMGALLGKKKKNPNKDFLEKKYMVAVENVAHGEVIYSYVDMDSFEDVNEFESNVTTSLAEKPTRLADRLNAVEQARGKHSDMAVPFRIMHLAAELKGKRDVTKPGESVFLQEEHVLCTIKAYQDGSIDMTPGFSPRAPLKVDTMNNNQYSLAQRGVPYRVVTGGGAAYNYWVINDTETVDPALALKLNEQQRRYQEGLLDKAAELRRNFVGEEFEPFSESPEEDAFKSLYNIEIVSTAGFEMDNIYVQYLVDVPADWSYLDAAGLWGNTQLSSTKRCQGTGGALGESVAHLAFPIEATFVKSANAPPDGPTPSLLLQVNSYDGWDRQRVLGYGHLSLDGRPGFSQHDICTWAPVPSQVGRLRSFFIGGSPELRDLTFAGVPTAQGGSRFLSRYGLATQSAGTIRLRINCLTHALKPIVLSKSGLRGSEKIRAAAHDVTDSKVPKKDSKISTTVRSRIQGRS